MTKAEKEKRWLQKHYWIKKARKVIAYEAGFRYGKIRKAAEMRSEMHAARNKKRNARRVTVGNN